jgi:hypothetical protein
MRLQHFHRIALAALPVWLAACAGAPTVETATPVPAKLQPAAGQRAVATVPAVGVQIYECRAAKDKPGQYEWAFVAPEAELYDRKGGKLGRHYAGPHWEALDGSRIAATLVERAPAPAADAIPWLLLAARSAGPQGRFSAVTSIQRVNTVGGVAPASGCAQATAGASVRVPYTADYVFFARN